MFFMCEVFFKHVVDNNRVQQYRYKSDNLNRRQISRTWQHNIKIGDNAGQFIKTFSLFYSWNKNILRPIYEFLIIKKKTWIGDHISIMFRFFIKAVASRTIWYNLKKAFISTNKSKKTQRNSYFKVRTIIGFK